MNFQCRHTLVLLVFLSSAAIKWTFADLEENFITAEEEKALAKLKPMIVKHLYKDYMKDDYYLLRFLRARNLNVDKTKEMLLESFAWRKKHGIDTILEKKESELEKKLHTQYILNVDRDGRPVIFFQVKDWKIRRYLLAGNYKPFLEVVYKAGEIAMQKFREASVAAGKNITTGSGVGDLAGFSTKELTCLLCMQLYMRFISHYENFYPQLGHKVTLVNSPRILVSLYEIVKPVVSAHSQGFVNIYGFDRAEWKKALLVDIAEDQIPTYLGGTYKQK